MKTIKFILTTALLCLGLYTFADDTATIQAWITAGNTTLPLHHAAYHNLSNLNITNNLNGNGDTIYYTGTTGNALVMAVAHKKVSNLILIGPSDVYNASGCSGISASADYDTVTNCVVKRFTTYGIVIGNTNFPEIYSSYVGDTGFISIFLTCSGANKTGGKVEYCTVDRSMLPAGTIINGAIQVRSTDSLHVYSDWLIQYNTISMPYNPTSNTAECCELDYCPFSTFQNNTCRGGSIGISVVRSDFTAVKVNFLSNQNSEGIEYADSNRGWVYTNSITNEKNVGILVDGVSYRGSANNILFQNTISGCQSYPVQLYHNVTATQVFGGTITTAGRAIYLQQASGLSIVNVSFKGNGAGTDCIYLDTSTGDIRMLGGLVNGFTGHVFHFYSATATTTDKISMQGVALQSTATGYASSLSGGAALGTNIRVN